VPPPRLFALVAREAPVAVVFRRGPWRQVLMLTWDLTTDQITPGQWLKGRTYPRRADLSPDASHLIYFAMNGHWQGRVGGSWTAISRPPFWTALRLYAWGDCWNGGGLFLDNRCYWLNGRGQGWKAILDCRLSEATNPPAGVQPRMGEDPVTYLPRLVRDGWTLAREGPDGQGAHAWTLTRPVDTGWQLEKTVSAGIAGGPNREAYWDTHRLIGPDGTAPLGDEWAEVHGNEILFARKGALWRQRPGQPARQVADLAPLTWQGVKAPYAGVSDGDQA
jgi:hypothetical protein